MTTASIYAQGLVGRLKLIPGGPAIEREDECTKKDDEHGAGWRRWGYLGSLSFVYHCCRSQLGDLLAGWLLL